MYNNNIITLNSQDGLRLTIQFASQEGEYELDADTQEDKNSVCPCACICNDQHLLFGLSSKDCFVTSDKSDRIYINVF